MTVQDVLAVAEQLSQEERLQVAILLLESLKTHLPMDVQYSEVKRSEAPPLEADPLWKTRLQPVVQCLIGAVPFEDEADIQEQYIDYLEEKYS